MQVFRDRAGTVFETACCLVETSIACAAVAAGQDFTRSRPLWRRCKSARLRFAKCGCSVRVACEARRVSTDGCPVKLVYALG